MRYTIRNTDERFGEPGPWDVEAGSAEQAKAILADEMEPTLWKWADDSLGDDDFTLDPYATADLYAVVLTRFEVIEKQFWTALEVVSCS